MTYLIQPKFVALIFVVLINTLLINTTRVHAHAWKGQAVVLFVTYEIRAHEIRGTLGLPKSLLIRELASRPSTLSSLLSTQEGYQELVSSIKNALQQNLPVKIDQKELLPQLTRIDLIQNLKGQNTNQNQRIPEDNKRDLKQIDGVSVETHLGAPEAAVINFSIPLLHSPREVRLLWKSSRWFIRSGRRGRLREELSTRKVTGIIIDQQQITPIYFTPSEPEVIWRSPEVFTPPKSSQASLQKQSVLSDSVKQYDQSHQLTEQFKSLHAGIYQAFKHQNDEEIYDALSKSLNGRALDEVFASTYRALILRDEGGARAQVTHVIPRSHQKLDQDQDQLPPKLQSHITQLKKQNHAYYIARHEWRVAGEVTHWDHTHRRVHDYTALYVMSKTQEGWRITLSIPMGQVRRPELEGGF